MRNFAALLVVGWVLTGAGQAVASDRDDALEILGQAIKAQGVLTPKAIIAVALFGQPADYPAISAIAKRHGLKLVADPACSVRSEARRVRRALVFSPQLSLPRFWPTPCHGALRSRSNPVLLIDSVLKPQSGIGSHAFRICRPAWCKMRKRSRPNKMPSTGS